MFESLNHFCKKSRFYQFVQMGLIFLPLILFTLLDQRIWQDDLSDYALQSLKLANKLHENNLGSWIHSLFTQDYFGKAPLMVWLLQFPALLIFINGDLNTVFLLFQLIFIIFSVVLGKLITKEFNPKNRNLFFGYCFLGVNLINGVAKSNYVENLQFTIILLTIYAYIILPKKKLSRVTYYCVLISLLSLLFLVKTNSLIFCWPFMLIMINESRRSLKFSKFRGNFTEITIIVGSLILFSISAAWYSSNIEDVLNHSFSSTGNLWSYNLSTTDRFFRILSDIQHNFIALILLLPMSIVTVINTIKKNTSHFNKFLFLLLLTLLSDIFYFILIDNSDPRLLYPILGLLALILSLLFANSNRPLRIFATTTVIITFWYININSLNINAVSIGNHAFVLQTNSTAKNDLYKTLLKGCPIGSDRNRIMLIFSAPELTKPAWDYHLFELKLKGKIGKDCEMVHVITTEGEPISIQEVERRLTFENFTMFIDSTAEWKKKNPYYVNWSGNINYSYIMKSINQRYPKITPVYYHNEWIVYEVRR